MLGRDGDSLSRNGYIYVKNNPLKYVDPTGNVAWNKFWEGTKQTFFGGLTTVFGVAEVAGGVALATGGTVATGGLGAVATVGGGVVVTGLGANNVVAGSTQAAGGITNMWNSLWEDDGDSEAVDYTYNPAHEAIDAIVPNGGGNTAAHVAYDVVDIVAGSHGVGKASSLLSGKQKQIVETENMLLKVNAGYKPDLSLLQKGKDGWRYHIGFHPLINGGNSLWHLGLTNGWTGSKAAQAINKIFAGSAKSRSLHIPLEPVFGTIGGIMSYYSHSGDSDELLDNK